MLKTRLKIHDIRLMVHLGYTQEERDTSQAISIDVEIHFPKPPLACQSDKLEDTVCYHTLVLKLRDYCTGKQFAMIEHLGHQLFLEVKNHIKPAKIKLSLKKLNPPVAEIKGDACFECEDSDE